MRAWALMVFFALPARAHVGPPFPVAERKQAGPYTLSVWTHPDTGLGAFYVFVDAGAPGKADGTRASVAVYPVTRRLPEAVTPAELESTRDGLRFFALVPFDREERWHWRARVEGPRGAGELSGTVYVTPPGPARSAIVLYFLPFLAVGALWGKALLKRRQRALTARAASGA